ERKARNFEAIHRVIMGLKGWLRGIHGHAELVQHYLDEYCYRYKRHLMKEGIFENLMRKMIAHPPRTNNENL
ncbi:MAG: IS1595 family transposase, partial [Cytophagaceae bacterium]|nr:IS1595 family transposase [Cytophagaceae bacterium]MDW8457287.1 IS1595 family transposase [Cytophagaceae bacterium]